MWTEPSPFQYGSMCSRYIFLNFGCIPPLYIRFFSFFTTIWLLRSLRTLVWKPVCYSRVSRPRDQNITAWTTNKNRRDRIHRTKHRSIETIQTSRTIQTSVLTSREQRYRFSWRSSKNQGAVQEERGRYITAYFWVVSVGCNVARLQTRYVRLGYKSVPLG